MHLFNLFVDNKYWFGVFRVIKILRQITTQVLGIIHCFILSSYRVNMIVSLSINIQFDPVNDFLKTFPN